MPRLPDAWTPHNLFGHAVSDVLWLLGLDEWARFVHEVTAPKDRTEADDRD